jgi:hypothetical protein
MEIAITNLLGGGILAWWHHSFNHPSTKEYLKTSTDERM